MRYEIEKSFVKDFKRIRDKQLTKAVKKVIERVEEAHDTMSIRGIKKMKGADAAYRIRVGNYRIGVFIENDTVCFTAFADRKDIYKKFP